ncbi:gfo/Idh/MocA family oxidoreductase [Paracoccus suum]|uniref:Gfo/Idh/MocA family oxidoreductase n=1 Tax=Paracoccus suum TaxID=2259340 RepID=A0A344PNL5_9RHOB|nr:Gfo/Idh/MocA family oxidoreductase [Paracoccus suum]AXC50970.1 gfo/Idh/MocA family oxidoreductase [Paracoccus suum]
MNEARFILVGLGARSRLWRQVMAADGRCRIVGIVDTNEAALAEAAEQLPDVVTGADLGTVAAAVPADAVLLITPPGGRTGQIAAAASAGLAILAEKPLADSVAEAEAHVATCAAAGVTLTVGLNFRYLAVTQALMALFAPDRLGAPAFGRFTYERWRNGYRPGINRYPLTMPQPMLWEQSIHHFDLMRFVYGADAVAISARTWNPPWSMYRGDANVSALITLDNGIEVTYQGTWAGSHDSPGFDWRTDCAEGIAVQTDMFDGLVQGRRHEPLAPVPLPPIEPWVDDAAGLLDDFLRHLLHGGPAPCTGADHLNSLRMVEACIESARTGQTIDPRTLTAVEPAGSTTTGGTE